MKRKSLLLTIVAVSLIVTFYCQKEAVFNKYVVQDDTTQYLPAVRALLGGPLEKALLQGDLIISYMVFKDSVGHLQLYLFLAPFLDPLTVSKLLPFLLCPISVLLLFQIVVELKNQTTAFFASLMFVLYVWTSDFGFFSGGLPKAFAFPLLFGFILSMIKKRFIPILGVLLLQVLFYPVVTLISLTVYFLDTIRDKAGKKGFAKFAMIGLICFVLAWVLYKQPHPTFGNLVTVEEMRTMPEFHSKGRSHLFVSNAAAFLNGECSSGIMVSRAFPLMFAAFLLAVLYLKRDFWRIPKVVFYLLAGGVFMFLVSYACLFHLFFPGRYLQYTLPVFLILVSAFGINKFLDRNRPPKTRILLVGYFTAIVLLVYLPFLKSNLREYEREILEAVKVLPDNAFIAGHPSDLNGIPLFCQKRVLIQEEMSQAWDKNYYRKIKERTYGLFRAYYAESLAEVKAFCRKYGITHLMINKEHFTSRYIKQDEFYLEPFNSYIKQLVEKKPFVLVSPAAAEFVVYESRKYIIFDVRGLLDPSEGFPGTEQTVYPQGV